MSRSRAVTLLVLVAAVLGSCSFGDDGGKLIVYFRDVGDLVERSTVQIADVEVGTVQDIDLVMQNGEMLARVTMSVAESTQVPAEGLQAVVRQTSLLGEQFVELVPGGSGPPFVGDGEITVTVDRTDKRVDVETFLADLSGLIGSGGLEDLNRFTNAQAMILEGRGDRFGETLDELATFTGVLADRRADVGRAIDGLAGASRTLAENRATLDQFLDSLEEANALLADQGDELGDLFRGLSRFGTVNARFLARHENAINRGFKALEPVLHGLAGAQSELRSDIEKLRVFLDLFPRSMGGGPGDRGKGDYIQADAVVCEVLADCHTRGEKGDVPGEGSR
jgi:phospholipid/cholesterol/gamma-HCH transport system substrate-binding protein